jgi:hypothetical protein
VFNLDLGQLKLVYEALQERRSLLDNAPHLTSSLPILMPCYKWLEVPFYWAGLKAYDVVARAFCLQVGVAGAQDWQPLGSCAGLRLCSNRGSPDSSVAIRLTSAAMHGNACCSRPQPGVVQVPAAERERAAPAHAGDDQPRRQQPQGHGACAGVQCACLPPLSLSDHEAPASPARCCPADCGVTCWLLLLLAQILYYDGQFDDARLNVALATTAAAAGAAVANYVEATGLIKVCVDQHAGWGGAAAAHASMQATR